MNKKLFIIVAVLVFALAAVLNFWPKKNNTTDLELAKIALPTERGVFGVVFTEEQLNNVLSFNLALQEVADKPATLTVSLHNGYASVRADWQDGEVVDAKLVADDSQQKLVVSEASQDQEMLSSIFSQLYDQFFSDVIVQKLEIQDKRLVAYFRTAEEQ